jgi:hypothetical protein
MKPADRSLRSIKCGSAAAYLLGMRVRIQPEVLISVSCKCRVLSVGGLCGGLITRSEESYRGWCVWVWSWNLANEEALANLRLLRHENNIGILIDVFKQAPHWPQMKQEYTRSHSSFNLVHRALIYLFLLTAYLLTLHPLLWLDYVCPINNLLNGYGSFRVQMKHTRGRPITPDPIRFL